MNEYVAIDSSLSGEHGIAQPLYFKSGQDQLFAWLHRPLKQVAPGLGVVICNPFGYESICAHRSIREFTDTVAGIGIPALRFDYLGTGDSPEIDEDADHIRHWTQDIIAAVHELERRTGVNRVCLLGIRLGALLAALAAAECRTIDSLILLGPVVSGRRYVRELRTAQLAGIALAAPPASGGDPDTTPPGQRALEAGGFTLSAATLKSLGLVDLQSAAAPPVRSILILDNDRLPSAKRWAESLSDSGISLDYRALPGLIEMTMTAPHFAKVPQAMIDATRQWLSGISIPSLANGGAIDCEVNPPATLRLMADKAQPQASITEHPVFIPADVTLFGIITEPRSDERRRRAVVLLNPGADFHIGACRMYVSLARRWARCGYFVLRLDLGGIGDSATRAGKSVDEVFPSGALNDIRAAVEWLRSRYGPMDITLGGLCSGAYHALQAAITAIPVNRAMMINAEAYFWSDSMSIYDRQTSELIRQPGTYRSKIMSAETWKRLFSGKINVRYVLGTYAGRFSLVLESRLRDMARRLQIRLPNDLGWQLEETAARGVRLIFVFSRGEPGLDLLRYQCGTSLERLGEHCRIHIVDNADHIFSKLESRITLARILSDELTAPP